MAGGLELGLELGEVLDDAVVHDEDPVVAVGVRVGVDESRFAVGRPTGMPNSKRAGRHVRLELVDQHVHLSLGLGPAGVTLRARLWRLQHRHARRVVATVLEALQALHEDWRRLALAEVADDSAHNLENSYPGWFRRMPG